MKNFPSYFTEEGIYLQKRKLQREDVKKQNLWEKSEKKTIQLLI